jgi:hypothetical protein
MLTFLTMVLDNPLPMSPKRAFELAIHYLSMRADRAPITIKQQVEIIGQFVDFCDAQDVHRMEMVTRDVVESFIHLPVATSVSRKEPSEPTRRNRRAALRNAYRALRSLDYELIDPTIDVETGVRDYDNTPVCDDRAIAALREYSLRTLTESPLPVILALAEAGATNAEMSEMTLTAFDANAGVVELPGSLRVDPRRNVCTEWGAEVFAERLHRCGPEALMIPNADGRRASSSSISQHFRHLAGFAALARRRYTVNSVRAWRALQIAREHETVESAARFLGIRSLDSAAAMIGWEWCP